MTSNLNKCGPKFDVKFELKFEGPILEIFGDFLRFWSDFGKSFKCFFGSAEGGRPAKGRGKHKAYPWVQI